jgi:hypothetical protein
MGITIAQASGHAAIFRETASRLNLSTVSIVLLRHVILPYKWE